MDGHGEAQIRKRQKLPARANPNGRKRQFFIRPHLQPCTLTVCQVYNDAVTFGWSAKQISAGGVRMLPAHQAALERRWVQKGQSILLPGCDRLVNLVVLCTDGDRVLIGSDGPIKT